MLPCADRDREKIDRLGRSAGSAAVVHRSLQKMPVSTVARLVSQTKLTLPTVLKALDILAANAAVREITGKQRHRVYRYEGYMNVLNEGTEPL